MNRKAPTPPPDSAKPPAPPGPPSKAESAAQAQHLENRRLALSSATELYSRGAGEFRNQAILEETVLETADQLLDWLELRR